MSSSEPYLTSRLRRLLSQIPFLGRAVALVWQAAPGWTTAWLLLLVIQGLLPVATVYLTRALVDGLVQAIRAGGAWEVARGPLLLAAAMAGLLLLIELLRAVTRYVRTAQAELVSDHISGLVQGRAVSADLGLYESSDYHDRLYLARAEALHRPAALVENLGQLLQSSLTLSAMAVVLFRFGWWLPLALVLSTLPALLVVLRFAHARFAWRMRTTEDERRAAYYDSLLTGRGSAAEVRLFQLGPRFRDFFQEVRARLRSEKLELVRSEAMAEIAAALVGLVVLGAAVLWMVWRALQGAASLGDLAMFYQAFNQGQRLMRSLLQTVGQIFSNSLYLSNLFAFLGMKPGITDPVDPEAPPAALSSGIVLRGVSFRYPGSSRTVLDGLDLEVKAGQVACLFGRNGAGKSTLLKLLCRLYDPDAGAVSLDGQDLRALRVDELRRLFTVLFQEPVTYSETAAQNVAMGDWRSAPERARIEAAVAAAGATETIARLPEGYDTMLGSWFEGAKQLSVGEWQRIALSRAFLRDAQVVLLDEPTSSMDAWAEAEWFERFRALVEGRTAVIVSHRLTTAMRADVIYVIEGGRVIEAGSHDELLVAGGRYAEAWEAHMGRPGVATDDG